MDTIVIVTLSAAAAAVLGFSLALMLRRGPRDPHLSSMVQAQTARLEHLTDALGRQAREGQDLRGDLGRTREILEGLRASAEERRRTEEQAWEIVRRMQTVLDGGGGRGKPGENFLHEKLSALPPDMLVRDFRVNGSVVEFALVLPDGRRLPVDSKWPASRELEALESAEDPQERERMARAVEKIVVQRALEVAGYIEADLTTPFAVACIPDAAYRVCRKAHGQAFARHVVLVPYGSALPTLLSLYAMALRYGGGGDVQATLADLEGVLAEMESTLENKLARASTMLANATGEWRTQLGKARGAVARGRGIVGAEADQSPAAVIGWVSEEGEVRSRASASVAGRARDQ